MAGTWKGGSEGNPRHGAARPGSEESPDPASRVADTAVPGRFEKTPRTRAGAVDVDEAHARADLSHSGVSHHRGQKHVLVRRSAALRGRFGAAKNPRQFTNCASMPLFGEARRGVRRPARVPGEVTPRMRISPCFGEGHGFGKARRERVDLARSGGPPWLRRPRRSRCS